MKHKSLNQGQLLIESLIGISIVVVGLLGIVGLVSRSLSLNRVISDQFTASYLSLEGIEIARNLLDSNIIQNREWNAGFASGDYSVYYDSAALIPGGNQPLYFNNDFYGAGPLGKLTPFKRTIRVDNKSDEVVVNSIVEWSSRGGTYEVNNEHHFYNWR